MKAFRQSSRWIGALMGTAVLAFSGMAWAAQSPMPATDVVCTPAAGIAEHENSTGTGTASITYDGSMACSGTVQSIKLVVSLQDSSNDSTWSTLITQKPPTTLYQSSEDAGPYTFNDPTPDRFYRTHLVATVTYENGTTQTSTINSQVDYAPFVQRA